MHGLRAEAVRLVWSYQACHVGRYVPCLRFLLHGRKSTGAQAGAYSRRRKNPVEPVLGHFLLVGNEASAWRLTRHDRVRRQHRRSREILVLNILLMGAAKLLLVSIVKILQALHVSLLLVLPLLLFGGLLHFHFLLELLLVLHDVAVLVDLLPLAALLFTQPLLLANLQLKHVAQLRSCLRIVHLDLRDHFAQWLSEVLDLRRHMLRIHAKVGELALLKQLGILDLLGRLTRLHGLQFVQLVHSLRSVLDTV